MGALSSESENDSCIQCGYKCICDRNVRHFIVW